MSHALFRKVVLGLSLVVLLGARAQAQSELLHDTWMKVKVQVKGFTALEDGSLKKGAAKTVAYLHFLPPEVEGVADLQFQIWCEVEPGSWEPVDEGDMSTLGSGDLLFLDIFMGFVAPDGAFFGGYHTGTIKVKTDKSGETLKKATMKTLGGECIDASLDGQFPFGGSLKVSGSTIPASKLPFNPMPV